MKSAERIVRHFATSEALLRGTALAANLILISIIATESGFGAEGILTAAFLQITISGLMEIPTARFADKRGWYRAVGIGLVLKVLTTLCYVGAVLAAHFGEAKWAWALIGSESVIDSFASAFINGAYQAGYAHWYDKQLEKNNINRASAPPLFIYSFRYGLFLRLLLPGVALGLGYTFFHIFLSGNAPLYSYLGLLSFIMVLRFVVIIRTHFDLKPFAKMQMDSAKQLPVVAISQVLERRLGSILLYAFASLISVASIFYFYGEIYRSLSHLIPGTSGLWLGGTAIGFALHIANVVISRATSDRLARASDGFVKQWIPAVVGVASFVALALLLLSQSEVVHIAALFGYSLIAMIAASFIQRWISSKEINEIEISLRATWFSVSEVIGLLAFGFLSGLSLVSGVPRAGIWILLVTFGLLGLMLSGRHALDKSPDVENKISLKQYLSMTLIGTTFSFFIVISIFDVRSFLESSKVLQRNAHLMLLQTAGASLREPVMQGSFTEVAARLKEISLNQKGICMEVKIGDENLGNCDSLKADATSERFSENIYFDKSQANVAATIDLYADDSGIMTRARQRLFVSLTGYLLLAGTMFFVIGLSSRRIHREVGSLLKPLGAEGDAKFIIREFSALREDILASQKLRDENVKIAAFHQIAKQVAHDVRSPLSALNLIVNSLGSELPEQKRVVLRTAAQRISDIANDLLQKNRPAIAGASSPTAQMLVSVVDAIVTEKRIQLRTRLDIEIVANLSKGYGLFTAIEARDLARAISNLINNSVEAIESPAGQILVSVGQEGDFAQVLISDNGPGIDPEVLAKLGDSPFSHGKESSLSGHGLGIYSSRRSIESVGGKFEIQSEVGSGTRVKLSVPKIPPPAWFLQEIPIHRGETIVSVDDDQSVHQIWSGRLDSAGAKTHKVNHLIFSSMDGFSGWLKDGDARHHLFLMDYEFLDQQGNGLELIDRLKIAGQSILVTSRYEEAEICQRAHALGLKVLPKGLVAHVPIVFS
jgi:signal transduction histidine kinase